MGDGKSVTLPLLQLCYIARCGLSSLVVSCWHNPISVRPLNNATHRTHSSTTATLSSHLLPAAAVPSSLCMPSMTL